MKARPGRPAELLLNGRAVQYRVTVSKSATRARLRVGPRGVDVIVPRSRPAGFARQFLEANAAWVLEQLEAARRIGGVRRLAIDRHAATVLYRGVVTPVAVERRGGGRCRAGAMLRAPRGSSPGSGTPAATVLCLMLCWLRAQIVI